MACFKYTGGTKGEIRNMKNDLKYDEELDFDKLDVKFEDIDECCYHEDYFGREEIRGFTDEERKIYEKILEENSIKTGRNYFDL